MSNFAYLKQTNNSAEELLEVGNYAYAFHKALKSEVRACARIMCGAINTGLSELEKCKNLGKSYRLMQAYGYWCIQETGLALEVLQVVGGETAEKFEKFIKHGAEVLIYSPSSIASIESFENIKLSYTLVGPDNLNGSIVEKNHSRDLVISIGVYGVGLPNNIFDLDCPVAFWVGDHDFFYATRHSDLSRATVLVTNSAGEHCELIRHYTARVASFPGHEFYIKSSEFPEVSANKNYDIGYTGRAFVPYMRDKAQFLCRFVMLNDSQLNIRIHDGYLPEDDFVKMMRDSRFVPLFWRYPGGIQTRAIDAMRQGAFVFSPEELTAGVLLGGEQVGFMSVCSETLERKVLDCLKEYKANMNFEPDKDTFREIFWSNPFREQRFIKFCLFQSIIADLPKRNPAKNLPIPAELRGYPTNKAVRLYTSVATQNMAAEKKTVAHYNYAASAAFFAATVGEGNDRLGKLSVEIFRAGKKKFPNNMVLKFNAARVLWTFGAKNEALILFGELSRSNETLQFDPKDAVLSHRIQHLAEMFSYGDFFKAALNDLKRARLMIQSCALTYLGLYAFENEQFDAASNFLKKAISLSKINVAAYKLLTEVLARLKVEAQEILVVFYKAIELYPPNLCDLLSFGVTAELAVKNREGASSLVKNYVLYYTRVRTTSGNFLPFDERSLQSLDDNQYLLEDWVAEEYKKIKKGLI